MSFLKILCLGLFVSSLSFRSMGHGPGMYWGDVDYHEEEFYKNNPHKKKIEDCESSNIFYDLYYSVQNTTFKKSVVEVFDFFVDRCIEFCDFFKKILPSSGEESKILHQYEQNLKESKRLHQYEQNLKKNYIFFFSIKNQSSPESWLEQPD